VDGDSDKDGDEMGGDEDDSDLDPAWKMLDIARAIVEKSPDNTLEKVKIFSALAEVSMERGILCHLSYSFPGVQSWYSWSIFVKLKIYVAKVILLLLSAHK
jgi:hypothetical protein